MDVAIVGTGYVGLVSGACFSEMGVNVVCVDTDSAKVAALCRGEIPIYEPGLEEMVQRNMKGGRLHFTVDLGQCINRVDAVFIAVGTPPREDGSVDLSYVEEVARTIGRTLNRQVLVVTKSTVPVGTSMKVKEIISSELKARGAEVEFDVASNPEFLKEGAAIKDFMHPDRIVVGTGSKRAEELMSRLYRPFLLNNFRVIFMDIASAEMTKYAANAMLATRISFMNEIANLCERVGADIDNVRRGIGTDSRIGKNFLYAGCGYGGSCFPKDVKGLIRTGQENNCRMELIEAVDSVNERQKEVLFHKLHGAFLGDLDGKRVAIWGLSFKPETDDMRGAPSLVVIRKLLEAGASVTVYDPVANDEAAKSLGDSVTYAQDMYGAVKGADALLLLTEWKQFRLPDWEKIKGSMRGTLIVDGRNIYQKEELKELGFGYLRIG